MDEDRTTLAFPKHFLDELRARTNVVELVGRRVQLKKRGRDHWGCCPFHGEKTASFKVSEDRDDYHCFGCGAHGSAFDFVMQIEGLSFPEAVERLAEAAGMEVPKMQPEDRQKADRMSRLAEANEAAAKWFTAQLHGAAGAEARAYLERRGVGAKAVGDFRLGFAPDRNDGLKSALLDRDFTEAEQIEAGLIAKPDDGRAAYDRFRNRLMFPIADRRGRVIAFGGRALGEARAKYLNSPETPLFHKSRALYNLAMAREAARDAGTVIVAEGYMDVIALAEAGFRHAVAPLGTAVTEEQIALLWQMTAEPVFCLDGDAAGLRAAQRAAERALPILKPGKSLRFALLPEGLDPDDMVRSQGPDAMRELLGRTAGIAETLWRAATADRELGTPERRAALEKDLERLAFQIADETIRRHFLDDFRARARAAFRRPSRRDDRPWRPGQPGQRGFRREEEDLTALRASLPANAGRVPEETIVAALLAWPELLEEFGEQLDALQLRHDDLDRALVIMRDAAMRQAELDSGALSRHLLAAGYERLIARLSAPNAARLSFKSRKDTPYSEIREQFDATLHHYRIEAVQEELNEAVTIARRELSAEAFDRVSALKLELDRLMASEPTASGVARAEA
ncbi:DNA primase [Minwuia thermotolerans]|uniref:DNA primase n=1 Tax=Minwuia thermotolerans TaxID=2056226 RepID=A0A2M9FZW3_9PROT|nr:DNA primase [Minwuia thermotolerans]